MSPSQLTPPFPLSVNFPLYLFAFTLKLTYPPRVADGLAPGEVAGGQHTLPGPAPHPVLDGLGEGRGQVSGPVVGEGVDGSPVAPTFPVIKILFPLIFPLVLLLPPTRLGDQLHQPLRGDLVHQVHGVGLHLAGAGAGARLRPVAAAAWPEHL